MVQAAEVGNVWTARALSIFLENHKKMHPGTKMTFVGLREPEERADVFAYIESVSNGG